MKILKIASCLLLLSLNLQAADIMRKIGANDQPDTINAGQPLEKNFNVLESRAPSEVQLDLKPWADGSWSIDKGILGRRYADSRFAEKKNWKDRYNYILDNPAERILKENDPVKRAKMIANLSPAEKYDILMGDTNMTLTKAQWAEGEKLHRAKTLAGWMGICEGSSAAGALYPEPQRTVEALSPRGDVVRFHVLDIKGLSALLWSSYNVEIPTAGSRCEKREKRNGIIMDDACFNSNPGTWHIAVLNFLALRNQTVFINRVNDTQVWNAAVIAYKLKYFPVKNEEKFDRLRHSNTYNVIGVEMKIKVAAGSTSSRDSSVAAKIRELTYKYDLELDEAGNIIGGEWRSDAHPDFIWAVAPGLKPFSRGDKLIMGQSWDGRQVPADWLEAARSSSQRNQPLEVVVRGLVEASSR